MAFLLTLWSLRRMRNTFWKSGKPFSKQAQGSSAVLVLDMFYIIPNVCESMHVCAHMQSPTWEKWIHHMVHILLFSTFCTSEKIRFQRSRSPLLIRDFVLAEMDLASGLWNSHCSGTLSWYQTDTLSPSCLTQNSVPSVRELSPLALPLTGSCLFHYLRWFPG